MKRKTVILITVIVILVVVVIVVVIIIIISYIRSGFLSTDCTSWRSHTKHYTAIAQAARSAAFRLDVYFTGLEDLWQLQSGCDGQKMQSAG